MTIVESAGVTGGVNIHAGRHVAAAIDDLGSVLGVGEFPTTPAGCQALLDWLASFGPVRRVGIDTTEDWGGWLARHLGHAGVDVVVVESQEGPGRRGDTVAVDALSAAHSARSGRGRALPAGRDALVEAIGVLLVARRSAEADRAAAVDGLRALVASAPSDLRLRLFHRSEPSLITEAAALRACPGHPVGYASRVALGELGGRAVYLDDQIGRLDELLIPLLAASAAGLVGVFGASADGTVELLAATDNEVGA